MKLRMKTILLVLMLLVLFTAACSDAKTPYQVNDAENYSVSVRYDANGGTFTTNTSVIVDSYNPTDLEDPSVALLAPSDPARGKSAFTAIKNGHFLAGWYAERTQTGTDEQGNPVYTYAKPWNFATDRLSIDPAGEYTAETPVLTLYAAWLPLFTVEFYDLSTGEYLDSFAFDPNTAEEIRLPVWDEESGAVEMFNFPARAGYTFNAAYYDAEGTQKVETETLTHPGQIDPQTATAQDTALQLYVGWDLGEWYHIYTADQFLDNASVTGSYVIMNDLDFTGKIWPSVLMHGTFGGTIEGNGHTICNITLEQTNNSKTNTGLFGSLTETALITDLTLKNVTVTIKGGTRATGSSFGLLAGTISDKANILHLAIQDSCLQIDSSAYFGTDDYVIGLLCGTGSPLFMDMSGIRCEAVGANPESIVITVEDGMVTVSAATNE